MPETGFGFFVSSEGEPPQKPLASTQQQPPIAERPPAPFLDKLPKDDLPREAFTLADNERCAEMASKDQTRTVEICASCEH